MLKLSPSAAASAQVCHDTTSMAAPIPALFSNQYYRGINGGLWLRVGVVMDQQAHASPNVARAAAPEAPEAPAPEAGDAHFPSQHDDQSPPGGEPIVEDTLDPEPASQVNTEVYPVAQAPRQPRSGRKNYKKPAGSIQKKPSANIRKKPAANTMKKPATHNQNKPAQKQSPNAAAAALAKKHADSHQRTRYGMMEKKGGPLE